MVTVGQLGSQYIFQTFGLDIAIKVLCLLTKQKVHFYFQLGIFIRTRLT